MEPVVKVRRSTPEHCSATSNVSRAELHHLYFSGGEFWFKKLRNTELRERGGEEQECNYATHKHNE